MKNIHQLKIQEKKIEAFVESGFFEATTTPLEDLEKKALKTDFEDFLGLVDICTNTFQEANEHFDNFEEYIALGLIIMDRIQKSFPYRVEKDDYKKWEVRAKSVDICREAFVKALREIKARILKIQDPEELLNHFQRFLKLLEQAPDEFKNYKYFVHKVLSSFDRKTDPELHDIVDEFIYLVKNHHSQRVRLITRAAEVCRLQEDKHGVSFVLSYCIVSKAFNHEKVSLEADLEFVRACEEIALSIRSILKR